MTLREFITIKREVSNLLSTKVYQNSGILNIHNWSYSPEKAEIILNLYTLLRQYKEYFPHRINLQDHILGILANLNDLSQRVISNVAANDERHNPLIDLRIYTAPLRKDKVEERLAAVKTVRPKAIPDDIYPVEEGNYFELAYFKERTYHCAIFVNVDDCVGDVERVAKVIKALSEAFIYQIIAARGYQDEETIKKLEESLAQSKGFITQELKEMSKDIVNEQAKQVSKDLFYNRLTDLRKRVEVLQLDINRYIEDARMAYEEKVETQKSLEYLLQQENIDYSEYLSVLSNFPEILAISTDGYKIIFDIVGQITIDSTFVNDRFIRDPNTLKFLEDLRDENISLNFVSSIAVDPTEGFLSFHSDKAARLLKDVGPMGNMYNNHHKGYACFGTFREAAKAAITAGNWIAVGLILIRAACDLNLVDGAVFPNFMSSIKNGQYFYYKNELMDYSDYHAKKRREAEENAN